MQYIDDYAHFGDVPLNLMIKHIEEHYPQIFDSNEKQRNLNYKKS